MKRLYIITLLMFLNVGTLFATKIVQEADSTVTNNDSIKTKNLKSQTAEGTSNEYEATMPTVLLPSPQAQAYMRYGEIPVSLNTGIPNISVPIYTLKANGLDIPINISYHASGRKVKDIPGTIGFGWVLNAGGMIAQTVYGRPDVTSSDVNRQYSDLRKLRFKSAAEAYSMLYEEYDDAVRTGRNTLIFDELYWYRCLPGLGSKSSMDDLVDIYPPHSAVNTISDRYSYNFNGRNGTFRYDLSTHQSNIGFKTIPYEPLKIDRKIDSHSDAISSFIITDENGIKWLFEDKAHTSKSYTRGDTLIAREYYLTSIKFPGIMDSVSFTYQRGSYYETNSLSESAYYGRNVEFEYIDSCFVLCSNNDIEYCPYPTFDYNYSYRNFALHIDNTSTSNLVLLTNIKWKDEEIIFEYSGSLLKKMQIKSLGQQIYNVLLEHPDFTNLASIKINNDLYSFKYNETRPPSSNNRDNEDFWGYYNGDFNKNRRLIPFEWKYNSSSNSFTSEYLSVREANPQYSQYGILTEITYPTKGKTVFEFEQNRGTNVYHGMKSYEPEIDYFGGLRIAKISNYDKDGHLSDWKSYEYQGGATVAIIPDHFTEYVNHFKIPTINTFFLCVGAEKYSGVYASLGTSIPFTELGGQTAFYHKVTEYNGFSSIGNGKTEYYYERDGYNEYLDQSSHYSYFGLNLYDRGSIQALLKTKKTYEYKNGDYVLRNKVNNSYKKYSDTEFITGIYVKHKTRFVPSLLLCRFDGPITGFRDVYYPDFEFFDIYGIQTVSLLESATETIYAGNDSLSTTKQYTYDSYLFPRETKTTNSDGTTITDRITYNSTQLTGVNLEMFNKHIYASIIKKERFKNSSLLATIQNNYVKKDSLFVIDNIKSSVGSNLLEERIKFHQYDKYGNPLYITKDGTFDVVYLWSYNGKYPVAEIKNTTYTAVQSSLGQDPRNLSSASKPDTILLNSLRTKIPAAHISTFDYGPFGIVKGKGITEINTYFEYDTFGRLIKTKDNNLSLIGTYNYGYAPTSSTDMNNSLKIANVTLDQVFQSGEGDLVEIPMWNPIDQSCVPQNSAATLKATITNGSSSSKYNWYLKDDFGNVVNKKVNSSDNTFDITFASIGRYHVVCGVADVGSGKIGEVKKTYNTILSDGLIDIKNISYTDPKNRNITAKVNCAEKTSVNLNFWFTYSLSSDLNIKAVFEIYKDGVKSLSETLNLAKNENNVTVELPQGESTISITVKDFTYNPFQSAQTYQGALTLTGVNGNRSAIATDNKVTFTGSYFHTDGDHDTDPVNPNPTDPIMPINP